jgi:centromere/kinetochore protein ZW10
MQQKASEGELNQALLEFVTEGKYPESEDVVASEFPSSSLADELERISKAREQAEVRKTVITYDLLLSLSIFWGKDRNMFS